MLQLSMFSLIFLCVFAINVNSWMLTDVDMKELMKMAADEYYDDYVYEDEDEGSLKFNLIYPGTKWCGTGNIADNYDDLGSERGADMCCREHDNCPDYIGSRDSKYNLTNNAFYSRLSCDCDETFRRCLRAAHQNSKSKAARNLGYIYFNALNTKCFRNDYPAVRCVRKGEGLFSKKCLEHEYDTSSPKRYQWFDVKNF